MATLTQLSTFNSRVDSLLQGIADTVLASADRDYAIREAIEIYNKDMPRRNVVEFAGDGGRYYLLWGAVHSVAQSTQDAGIELTDADAAADQRLAISVTLDRTYTIYEWHIYLKRTGATVAGDLLSKIYTNASSLPSAVIAASENVDIDDDAGPPEGRYAAVKFALDEPVTLPAGTYHFSVESSGYDYVDGTTEVILGVDQSSVTNTVSTYDGSSWSAYGTDSAGIIQVVGATPGWRSPLGIPIEVEYPAADVSSDEQPNVLEDADWQVYQTQAEEWPTLNVYLFMRRHSPSSSEKVRIRFSNPYVWDEAEDPRIDTPAEHFTAICYLAASLSCLRLSNKFGQKRSSTLQADVADRSRQGEFYRSQAKQFRSIYEELLGIDRSKSAKGRPGSAVYDMDIDPGQGRDFLFHGRRQR